jgi:molybdenum cofactor synthesis domain-containing protein
MVERTAADGDHVQIFEPAAAGDHVRPAGGDVDRGQTVFSAGTVLGPAHLGVLASLDVAEVRAFPRVRVGVLSTGDEIVESGPLAPGQIRDSNRPMLLALLRSSGCEGVDLGIARDDEALIEKTLGAAVESCDAVITSGAVSVGDYDFVKIAIERLAERDRDPASGFRWSQVAIKPAKPLAYGQVGGVPIFGLPGNPVSSHVSFEIFTRPALLRMMGHEHVHRAEVDAIAPAGFARRPDGKLHLDRVRVRVEHGRYVCERSGFQASNVLSGMANANGLALVPDGDGVAPGGVVRVWLLDDVLA